VDDGSNDRECFSAVGLTFSAKAIQIATMNLGIAGRLALVTGSSRGIGRSRARVVLVARSSDALEAVRREMPDPEKHHLFAIDLMAKAGVRELADAVLKLGELDIIVHNLGGSAGVFKTTAPAEDWKHAWQFNVGVSHELNCLLIPPMVERRWGRIVHLSTLSATTYHGYAPHVSAKCALTGYVKAVSREFCMHNVILSAVAPGGILIPGRHFAKLQKEDPAALEDYFDKHVPIRRLGTPEEVASVAAFLCSEKAAFMPGAIVAVDGGAY
jgi:3-oxoacyl-[acyl-carrier protein] reductase